MVPEELGGGGKSFPEMCELLERMATLHSSTTLSLSMHQHIVVV
ncbi:acyl-CoA dehydrogenase family protein [Photobacterium proteolyticum]